MQNNNTNNVLKIRVLFNIKTVSLQMFKKICYEIRILQKKKVYGYK